jgi:hypothetical protein
MRGKLKDPRRRAVADLLKQFFGHLQAQVIRGSAEIWKRIEARAAPPPEQRKDR